MKLLRVHEALIKPSDVEQLDYVNNDYQDRFMDKDLGVMPGYGKADHPYVSPEMFDNVKSAREAIKRSKIKLDFVRVNPGRGVREHYHKLRYGRVEDFTVVLGEGILQTRWNENDDRDEVTIHRGDKFVVLPGMLHRVLVTISEGPYPLYLARASFNNYPDDLVFTELND